MELCSFSKALAHSALYNIELVSVYKKPQSFSHEMDLPECSWAVQFSGSFSISLSYPLQQVSRLKTRPSNLI